MASISVSTAGLTKGTYVNTVTIFDSLAGNSPVSITVTINVVGAEIGLNPSSLTLNVTQGQSEQTAAFYVTNVGPTGSLLTFTSSTNPQYGDVIETSGSGYSLAVGESQVVFVTSRASNRAVGTYTDYAFIVDSNDPSNYKYVTVTVNVQAAPLPVLGATTDVYFTAVQNGPSPAAQNITISNSGPAGSSLNWLASLPNNRYSLSGGVSPLNGGFYTNASLTVNTAGLSANTYEDAILIYSPDDPRVVSKTIRVHITITGQSAPSWGAFESGSNGRSSDQWYSISSAEMRIRFWAQPFVLADRFIITDDLGNVYLDSQFSTEDNSDSIPLSQQHPRSFEFTKPAGVTRLRVRVIPNGDSNTGWWYKGVAPGQLWY